MPLTRPQVLTPWADAGDKVAPTAPEVSAGWPVTNIPPSRQRFNWFFNLVHNGVRYLTRRGLADWSADEDYKVGDRCLAANGMTYRCLADHTNIVPGTDATKWERWGYAQSELAAYLRSALLSPVRCPVTGPAANPSDASPYTMWQSVAPYNEYWMWMGDAWKVVANRYAMYVGVASTPRTANVTSVICSLVVPRAGFVIARGILSQLNEINANTYVSAYIKHYRGGAEVGILLNSLAKDVTTVGTQYSQVRPLATTEVLAGDQLSLEATATQNMYASSSSNSSIHVEYLQ